MSRGVPSSRTARLSLLEADWPEADRTLLARLLASRGLFDEVRPLAQLKPISRKGLVTAYGRWLGWLSREKPAALLDPPVDRATPERFYAWLASERGLAPPSRHTLGSQALRLLKAAEPQADWSLHSHVLHVLWAEVTNHRSTRKDGRIISASVLLAAALERSLSLGHGSPAQDLRTAIGRRDAAMVAFLAVLPIRRRGFCSLELGTSFLVEKGSLRVVLDASLTKNAQSWEAPVPAALAGIMTDYLEHVRPLLLARGEGQTRHLWLNDSGRPYFAIHLADRIRRITLDFVGVRVTPHFFRDCAATTLAYDSLDGARLTRALLGHSSFGVAERHYNQAKGIEAGRCYAAVIARLGDKLP